MVLILDSSGSMSSYSSQNREWMLRIVDNFPISEDHTRVSLILVFDDYNIIWNLESQYTTSNETLAAAIQSYPTDEALSGYTNLGPALDLAYDEVLSNARDGATKIIVMFWDGDNNLSSTVSRFTDTRYFYY